MQSSFFPSVLLLQLLASSIHAAAGPLAGPVAHSPPTVDLGYAIYAATAFNETGQYFNFSNIRYAAPPVGDLRWRAPTDPLAEKTVNHGNVGYICPQAPPFWFQGANAALGNLSEVIPPALSSQSQSEDCLFLDVITPIKPFRNGGKPASVVVNIHGGGFWIGEKRALYPPNGLMQAVNAQAANDGIIYVSMNYRLAAFGFLSGQEESSSNQTVPNAGLLDQRFALKWVQKYIHLFGGDPNNVTIIGESAGGASVQYQSVAYGGEKEANLFHRGIAQSPAPLASDPVYAGIGANLFLKEVGVSTIDAARNASTEVLQQANINAQNATPSNVVYFGPVVDNDFLLDIIPRSYNKGKYLKNITMIAANNQNEARFLGNQSIQTSADFNNWVYVNFPSADKSIQDQIINKLYPPVYNGTQPYKTPQQRSDLAVKEYLISCNTVSIANAYQNQSYNYIFGVAPAIHAQDLGYTFTPNAATPGYYPQIAKDLQTYLASFILTGDPNPRPNASTLPEWSMYGDGGKAINFTVGGVEEMTSDADNGRCAFWNAATYYPKET